MYFMERNAAGFVLGFGYDYFTPPANVYLLQDELVLKRLDLAEQTTQVLTQFQLEPRTRRWLEYNRGGIFANDQVLHNGRELLIVKGVENFGSAILAVDEAGRFETLVTSPAYQHREGVLPPLMGAPRRKHIEAARDKKAFE